MRKFLIIVLVVIVFGGCAFSSSSYPFPYKGENIVSIELLHNPKYGAYTGQKFELERILEPGEIDAFMNALYQLPTTYPAPAPRNFGENIVRVTYENGDVEYFASWHIEVVKEGQSIKGSGSYCFSGEGFNELFNEYVNAR